jgi:uncharacterized protein involved in outer membrane biogenesis
MDEQTTQKASRSWRGRATVLILVLVIGFVLAAVLAIPLFLNTQAIKNALLHQFEQRTGHRVAVEDLELRLFPRPRLDLRQVKVLTAQSEAPLVSARRLELALQLVPLLEGRAVAAYVVLESPRITVRRHPSGQWTVGDREPTTASDDAGEPLGFLATVRNLLIVDGAMTILDQSRSIQSEPVQLA